MIYIVTIGNIKYTVLKLGELFTKMEEAFDAGVEVKIRRVRNDVH